MTIIAESKIIQLNLGYLFDQFRVGGEGTGVFTITNKVVITDIFQKTIGNDNVPVTVIVEIGNQRRPAPVGLRYAAHKSNITENGCAQRVVIIQARPHV